MAEYPQQTLDLASNEGASMSEILLKWASIVRKFWYWFVLSTLVALVVGYLFWQSFDRVYSGRAVVLIEDSRDGGYSARGLRAKSQMNSLLQLNGISVEGNLDNEIFILTSQRLMERVVERLGLTVDYVTAESLHQISLYKRSPIRLSFDRPSPRYDQLVATIEKDGSVTLSDFAGRKSLTSEQKDARISIRPGQSAMTPLGRVRLEANENFATFPRGKEITVHHYSKAKAAVRYQRQLSADMLNKQSTLINLNISDINPLRAKDILNEVCAVYKADIVENKNRVAQSTARFIDERLALISSELSEVERRQATYKEQNNIVDVAHAAERMGQLGVAARQRTQEANAQLNVAQWVSDFLNQQGGKYEVIPTIVSLPATSVSHQITDYNRLALERGRIVANSSEQNAAVREIERQLTALRSAIQSTIASHVKSLRLELAAAQSEEGKLKAQASTLPGKERAMADIARQQGLKAELYTYLLNKREEVALQLAIEEANIRIVEPPLVGETPVAPRAKMNLLVAFFVGLLLPALIIWLRELLDTTISSRAEIEELSDIPILGELPHMDNTDDNTLVYGPGTDQNSPVAEAFRLLRYGLHFMNRDARVLLITSSTPSHGKSFVSRNLASSLAMTGKRVVLIDTDIRVRNLSRSFAPLVKHGLTEWLVGDCQDAQDLVCPDAIVAGVDFIPAGITPPNVTELLMNARLEALIEQLRQSYDYILLDTTPCFSVADASIVSRVADVTLLIMRVGHQPKAGIPPIIDLYESGKIGNMCLVINDCDVKARTYGYSYGCSYGYSASSRRRWWKRRK